MAEEKVPKCPVCGGIDLVKKKRGWTITTGVFGMNKMQYHCQSCGKKFMENKAVYE
ncbi:hypothetical protein [Heyndrickxia acidiproducens]|uniref:hypothetical protein n=1 Tax=Heyndrickxia acidiproducens TaxID=1121084 RepID=UPI000370D5F4|nr:hypothetical protein [Heyndrickxia acidiproducens]